MSWITNLLLALYKIMYAPALMAVVATAASKYGTVEEFRKALTAPGDKGGILQSQREIPGLLRGWACTIAAVTPGDDMLTYVVNLAAEMGLPAPKAGGPIAQAVSPPVG